MSGLYRIEAAPVGSTGNNNHAAVAPHPGSSRLAIEFNVEAVGATPTVTYALQGSVSDSPTANDWETIFLLPPSSDTPAANRVVTGVGKTIMYVSLSHIKFFARVRLVTSANTNVTYSAKLNGLMAGL